MFRILHLDYRNKYIKSKWVTKVEKISLQTFKNIFNCWVLFFSHRKVIRILIFWFKCKQSQIQLTLQQSGQTLIIINQLQKITISHFLPNNTGRICPAHKIKGKIRSFWSHLCRNLNHLACFCLIGRTEKQDNITRIT